MCEADHTYDHHPLYGRLENPDRRGTDVALRAPGVDPDAVQACAKRAGAEILEPAQDSAHGWRDVMAGDMDSYVGAVGMALKPVA